MSSGASKPYLNLKQSLIQFFSAPTRYLKESIQKESVFEKPYWDGEYPSMHLDIPAADWPSWSFEDDLRIRRRRKHPSGGGGFMPTPRCPGCALYADASYDCTNDPVEIHSGIFCTNTPGAATNRILTAKQKQYELSTSGWDITGKTVGVPYGVQAGDTVLEIYAQVGSIKQVTIGQWAFIGPSAAVWVDPSVAEHTICGRMIDGAGSVCYACVDVSCCACANPPSAFQISSYDSTIAPGGSAFVTVSGGCGPYSYSVSGLGYTISGSGVTGTLISAAGACGVDYGAVATVTAQDVCGSSASCKIRNTGGKWVDKGGPYVRCTYSGSDCLSCSHIACFDTSPFSCTGPAYSTAVDGETKWGITGYECNCCAGNGGNSTCLKWCDAGGLQVDSHPTCTPPHLCSQGLTTCSDAFGGGYDFCEPDTSAKCKWECSGADCSY